MPQRAWSDKRERQYEHIKEGLQGRGAAAGRATEIAARTVNKERARSGEANQASPFDQRCLLQSPGRPALAPRPGRPH